MITMESIEKKLGFNPITYDWLNNPLDIGTDANPDAYKGLTKEEVDFVFEESLKHGPTYTRKDGQIIHNI